MIRGILETFTMATEIEGIKEVTEAILGIGEVSIDNFTFKLFYKWSVSFFISGSVLVQASQFFGDPIACETVSLQLAAIIKCKTKSELLILSPRLMTLLMRKLLSTSA